MKKIAKYIENGQTYIMSGYGDRGQIGPKGDQGEKGDPLKYSDLTDEEKAKMALSLYLNFYSEDEWATLTNNDTDYTQVPAGLALIYENINTLVASSYDSETGRLTLASDASYDQSTGILTLGASASYDSTTGKLTI